jgi:hypothetical protein
MHDEPEKTPDEIRSYPDLERRWVWGGFVVYVVLLLAAALW